MRRDVVNGLKRLGDALLIIIIIIFIFLPVIHQF